ncbi:cytochrome c oxidase subunit 8B [Lepisosteus oculatus]|uniref:cytochrome c oxidase subunit 8B n=1 Tax=Lepisosteus oculatus TaxID=7918 RepID=UPI00073FCF6C|nr:PREDICTED: cytochrome c oxidase subunit 8B, mitochondrial [Lepisosteus oculatus]
MLGLNHTFRLLGRTLRQQITPKASITSKPPKEVITPGEQAVALVAMFIAILVPSGWILSHLDDYKRRK